ncbi:conserved unknown protein [Ectocarpus siliculosus]|uniref:Cilia- and flagella-associated protein 43 n=1 Tax=Ectocarpus siliculosus TaxID=2880 RepID=D7G903_ECTSI|nr:conserved unknown protein [Ectocarpus siliculosus]|eukprot:CBJ28164.1 conserved unknown protein [Ectocarpus siliculosus]
MVLRGTLLGGTDLRYTDVAFSRDGARVAAFGNRTDHLATVWNVKKASADEEELTGEKVVEAVLPGDMSFLSFNPADSDQLCIGGASGLYFWRVDNLVDNWVISPTKAKAPAPRGRGKRNLLEEEDDIEVDDVNADQNAIGTADRVNSTGASDQPLPDTTSAPAEASASRSPSSYESSQPETGDAAGAVAAAEIFHLENLVTMGDGKHDSFTCHCWGLESTLWAVNEPGQLACFDANTGKYTSCVTLSRASNTSDGEWTAVGLLMTKTHIVVTGSDGSIEWLALPTESGGSLEVLLKFLSKVEFSIQLLRDDSSPCRAVAMACSPLYDKMVVGSSDGSLYSVFVDFERHASEPGMPSSGVNSLRTFHSGKVVALTCLRPLSAEVGDSGGVLITGGEDGAIRAWTAGRGKLCGTQTFSAFSTTQELDEAIAGDKRASLDERIVTLEGAGDAPKKKGDVPVPVCALASCRAQPLVAIGLCHGAVHIAYVKQTSAYDVDMTSLWSQRFYRGPASQLCFHPTKTLLAIASTDDRSVHVINFHNSMGDFVVCGVGVAPQGQGGVNGLMWRGVDIVFSTEDCLVCALQVKSERRARPTRVDPLSWVLRTPTPLHGMRPHPQIRHGPFFAVSADMRVLQVLPALPDKGIPSTLADGGEPKALSPLDTLEAHQKGVAVMAASPDGRFMATGGADGLVCLWMVYENQVELLNSALVHAGPVISLAFAANSATLFTTSLDATVFGLALEGLQEGSEAQPPPVVATLERLADRRAAAQKMQGGIIERLDGETWRQESAAEVRDNANIELDAVGIAQRKVVGEFKERLARIIEKNETLPELEKMERSEFVVDVAGRDRKIDANEAAAKKLGEDIRTRNLGKELIASRIKIECWDSMEVQKKQVWRIQPDGVFVENFAIRRRSPEELALINKVKQMRALELRDVRRGTYSASRAWPGLLDEDDDGSDDEDKDEEDTEDPIAALEVLEAADETDPTYLLYPPLALRTPRQRRTQIVLLGELVLDIQRAFNRHLDKLHSAKEDCMDKVEEKNNRIQEILVDLGSDETFFRPKWLDLEQPEEVFNVESDMTVKPYESEADKEARRKAEEEKRRREEEAKGSNDKFRALDDMMHGTLEVKQDALTVDAVKKPDWMDEVAPEDMTEDQKKEAEEYEAKLKEVQEEQATYRKALELELKKLRTEVADIVKAFDDRLKEMCELRVQVQMFIASQELLLTRLAMGIVEREDDDVTMEKLDKALGELFEKKALAQERLEGYRLHVEQAREEIETLQAEDRLMERNFKKEIQEAASNPIDMAEMMAQLVQLYKLRDHSTMSTGGSSGYRGSATGMSNATSYRKSQSR